MYDTAIIGGGPAGYLAAERLGAAGKTVLLVEKGHLGGTCLNVGCVPTKTLLASAKAYVHAKEAGALGVTAERVSFDLDAMMKWKGEVVSGLRSGIASQMKRYKVDVVDGSASIVTPNRILVKGSDVDSPPVDYDCKTILVATGSSPAMPPIPGTRENPKVVDSTGLLETGDVPKRLCVIGGGVIGVEFASLFSSLGSRVTVIEMMDEIVPFMDREQAPILRKALKGHTDSGVEFKLGCTVKSIEGGLVNFTTKQGAAEIVDADLVLMAVGRRPNTTQWGGQEIGLDITPKGVVTDDRQRTNIRGIWAAGDVTGKSQLAHSAYRMAEVAIADILSHLDGTPDSGNRMRCTAIPWAVYSIPEAAGVGMTEQEAESRGIRIVKASIPMKFSGRFVAENGFSAPGTVKVIAEAPKSAPGGQTPEALPGRILGIHAIGSYSSEFIWGGAALIEQELRVSDVKQLIFPHPTVCELIRDAVWEL